MKNFVKIMLPLIATSTISIMPIVCSCSIEDSHENEKIIFVNEKTEYLSFALANKSDTKHIEFACQDKTAKELKYSITNSSYIGTPYKSTIDQEGGKWYWNFNIINPETMVEKEGQGYVTIYGDWINGKGNKIRAACQIHWYFNFG